VPDADERLAWMRSLRATRWFRDEPVAPALVDELLDVARWTGSARNRQPWRGVVVTDLARRARLAELGAYAGHLAGAPLVVLLAVDVEGGGEDAEFDAGRFAQTFMLAAHARGLGTCPASFFPAENARRATALADLAAPWRVRTAISLGCPAPSPRPGATSAVPRGRKPLDALRSTAPPVPRADAEGD
jgi:nitroreductase